jgi:hypothetical protein
VVWESIVDEREAEEGLLNEILLCEKKIFGGDVVVFVATYADYPVVGWDHALYLQALSFC